MSYTATVVTTWDLIGPIMKLGLATALSIAALIVLCRSRWSWWRAGIAIIFASVSFGVARQFFIDRNVEAEAHRRINTLSLLNSLNSLFVTKQISDRGSTHWSDADAIGNLLADEWAKRSGARFNDQGSLIDYWDHPLYTELDSGGRRVLRSAGPDGQRGTTDDL